MTNIILLSQYESFYNLRHNLIFTDMQHDVSTNEFNLIYGMIDDKHKKFFKLLIKILQNRNDMKKLGLHFTTKYITDCKIGSGFEVNVKINNGTYFIIQFNFYYMFPLFVKFGIKKYNVDSMLNKMLLYVASKKDITVISDYDYIWYDNLLYCHDVNSIIETIKYLINELSLKKIFYDYKSQSLQCTKPTFLYNNFKDAYNYTSLHMSSIINLPKDK